MARKPPRHLFESGDPVQDLRDWAERKDDLLADVLAKIALVPAPRADKDR